MALAIGVVLHGWLALGNQSRQVAWAGIPPAPPVALAPALALGDAQLFYRAGTLGLQQQGDGAGRAVGLAGYDYGRLDAWLTLLDRLDPAAAHAPTLAGLYFSQTTRPEDLRQIVDHLVRIGARDPGRHWRWLAHATYLARHRLADRRLALAIAHHLAGLTDPGIPIWVRQLPAFAMAEVGEAEAARDLLEVILATEPDLPPDEAAFMRAYVDERLGLPERP